MEAEEGEEEEGTIAATAAEGDGLGSIESERWSESLCFRGSNSTSSSKVSRELSSSDELWSGCCVIMAGGS